MSAPATVPVTVTPEAVARVADLGMQTELEQMIEHTRQVVPGLLRIEVVLEARDPTGEDVGITLFATSARSFGPEDRTMWNWDSWVVQAFSPRVCEHFVMMLRHENGHAG